jgi:hypothetical protein
MGNLIVGNVTHEFLIYTDFWEAVDAVEHYFEQHHEFVFDRYHLSCRRDKTALWTVLRDGQVTWGEIELFPNDNTTRLRAISIHQFDATDSAVRWYAGELTKHLDGKGFLYPARRYQNRERSDDVTQSDQTQPVIAASVFIGHSSKDKTFCDRLYTDLKARGIDAWYFPEDAKWGAPVWSEIDKNIKVYDRLIVVCSEHSLQSGPVLREIERALVREDNEGKNVLFPITIDDYLLTTWNHPRKVDVLAKVVGEFRGWQTKPSVYSGALTRSVGALH